MKKLLMIIFFLLPSIACAQLTVPQGGTGTTTFPLNYVLLGNSSLRLKAVATSTLGIALSDTVGILAINQGGTGTTTWQTGSIPFYNGTNFTENNANLFWDNTNNRLGIGSSSPATTLTVVASSADTNNGVLRLVSSTANNYAGLSFWSGLNPNGVNDRNWQIANNYQNSGSFDFMRSTTNTGNPTTAVASFTSSGSFGIGTTSPSKLLSITGGRGTYFDGSGNVGIGTASPIAPLHVETTSNKDADGASIAQFGPTDSDTTGAATIEIQASDTSRKPGILIRNRFSYTSAILNQNSGLQISPNTVQTQSFWYLNAVGGVYTNRQGFNTITPPAQVSIQSTGEVGNPLFDVASTTSYFRVTTGGAIGIGTTTPFWALTVASSTGPQLALSDASGGSNAWTFRSTGNTLYIATSTNSSTSTVAALTINPNGQVAFMDGNVGIGTTTPTAILSTIAASSTVASDSYKGLVSIIAGLENTVVKLFQEIDQWGHLVVSGDAPTVTSCTGGSVNSNSNDRAGAVTFGAGLTSCAVLFAHPYPTGTTVHVFINQDSGTLLSNSAQSISTTGFTITSASIATGDVFSYNVVATQ